MFRRIVVKELVHPKENEDNLKKNIREKNGRIFKKFRRQMTETREFL